MGIFVGDMKAPFERLHFCKVDGYGTIIDGGLSDYYKTNLELYK